MQGRRSRREKGTTLHCRIMYCELKPNPLQRFWKNCVKKYTCYFCYSCFQSIVRYRLQIWLKTCSEQYDGSCQHLYYPKQKVTFFISIVLILGCYNARNCVGIHMFLFMMTSSNGNIFRFTGPLCGEFTGYRWIPITKANDAKLWCFL